MRDRVVSLEWIACAELAPLFRYGCRRKYNIRQLSSNAPGAELTGHHPSYRGIAQPRRLASNRDRTVGEAQIDVGGAA
jgi:hypothetical protein